MTTVSTISNSEANTRPPVPNSTISLSRSGFIRSSRCIPILLLGGRLSVLVVPAQHIHHFVIGDVTRYVVMVHDIAHTSLHTRYLVTVIGPPVLLPTRVVAAEATRVIARKGGDGGPAVSSC